VSSDELRAISLFLRQLDRLGAPFEGQEESRLLRFALTDACNAGARATATVTGASVTTLLSDLPSLLEEEIAHGAAD
jgi:hypothetical protein